MDINDLHPPDDYSHRFFIWHEWIQANGPLTSENVFEYFTTSMFYDKQSNNQVLRMQTMHTGATTMNEAEELKRFTGVEFAVVHAQPPSFFIIQKRERHSPEEVTPLSAYFIINNRIYQSPDLYTVLSNRLLTSLTSLQASLDILRSHRPDYTPRTGFVWPIMDPSLDETAKKPTADDLTGAANTPMPDDNTNPADGNGKRQQNTMLLFNAMRATALHSSSAVSSSAFAQMANSTVPPTDVQVHAQVQTPAAGTQVSTVPSQASTPAPPPQEPPGRGPPGGGKKKRKRTLLPVPAGKS
ncbi:MED6-domain-containing protein [Guyanagaster necrorhizus]|uniref:Mediator of RNA polymerase II transcription subunit 6 n=1 Tax=Guyanagaster necrorhizus TaxID=856835 RepID=A0A9P8AWI0_9AGAR|nr:MED6-domain-containing protein [Guyanagaster necrorhizus MCA 3950]KAG7450216.1 MED6-domain-containing protein [Guyanagaster necrorhizus MCA 3950]